MSARIIDNPKIAASAGLIFDRLRPAVTDAFNAGVERYPDDSDEAQLAIWMSGALYGVAAHLAHEAGSPEAAPRIFASLCELLDDVFGDEGDGTLDSAMERLVPGLRGGAP